jgi:hypothetical protein
MALHAGCNIEHVRNAFQGSTSRFLAWQFRVMVDIEAVGARCCSASPSLVLETAVEDRVLDTLACCAAGAIQAKLVERRGAKVS